MIRRSLRKIFTGLIVSTYLISYLAPVALCAPSVQMSAEVNKPVLRNPAKTHVAPKSLSSGALKLEGDVSITKTNHKISLSLRDSDVQQVLRMFADKAGLNIIFHPSATGKVTLDLVNVPLNDAFKMILQVSNLTYYLDKNTMVVTSAAAAQSLNLSKQEMYSIPIKYADASILANFLNQNIFSMNKPGLSNAQIVITNPSANELLIFGTENDYRMAKKIAERFDVEPNSKTFVVNHTTPKEMANLICDVLLQNSASSGKKKNDSASGSSSSSSSSSSGSKAPADQQPEAAPASTPKTPSSSDSDSLNKTLGALTGGASDSSDSSSSSSDSSDKDSGSSDKDSGSGSSGGGLKLGTGKVACTVVNNVSAGSLSSLKENNLSITYFQQRGTINVMGGSLQQLDMIKKFIEENDQKQPQAYLELSIIELNESGSKEFTNTWQILSSFFSGSFTGNTATNPMQPNFFMGDGLSYYKMESGKAPTYLYSLSKYTGSPIVTYSMNYVLENSKGRVLANPKIMITNGKKSTIDLSSDYVKSVKSQVLSNAGGLAGAVQRTYEIGSDEGIKVELTPFISPDGYVTLNIKPDYSTVKEPVYVDTVVGDKTVKDLMATLLQRRNLDLKSVRIKDGETLVIGGMMREVETKGVSKIPILGDLPGVGVMFRNSSTKKERQELVIMITPRIVKDMEDMVHNSDTTL